LLLGAGANAVSTLGTGTAGQVLVSGGASANPTWSGPVTDQILPGDPAATASAAGVMMGLNGSITPVGSGKIMIVVSGDINNTVAGDGAQIRLRTGTGTAPANGGALAGTTATGLVTVTNSAATTIRVPFSLNAIVTGSLNQANWIDVELAEIGGGTAQIRNVTISAYELK